MTRVLFESDKKVSFFEKAVAALSKETDIPRFYGIFHIASLLLILLTCAFIIKNRKKLSEKALSRFILICGCVMLAFEIYKQLVITYEPSTDRWVYEYYAFPFQFCSTPTYIALLSFLFCKFKNKMVYKALLSFLATYGMIAATVVLFFGTSTVLCSIIGVNVQTMVHHGLMLIMSVAILASGEIHEDKSALIGAGAVFFPLLIIAIILNACIKGLDLFYLSPDSTFVYKSISDIFFGSALPYPIYLIGYIILFTAGAALILFISHKIKKPKS